MPELANKLITSVDWHPGDDPKDGLGLCDWQHWDIKNCVIDMSHCSKEQVDEAVGITRGSSATFTNCVIRGAGKNILCGCGDAEYVPIETGKRVEFDHCVIENFGRRGPEVQDGMVCTMKNCLVWSWGDSDHFDTRAFGAWAHKGGSIHAENTVFIPVLATLQHWFIDHIFHFSQAVKERGFFKALFHRDAWLSGYKRALTAGVDGTVSAYHCFAFEGAVIDNHTDPMTKEEAFKIIKKLSNMQFGLGVALGWSK